MGLLVTHCYIVVFLMSRLNHVSVIHFVLSYDIPSGSEITPCIKIDKPPVFYRFWGNYEMKTITTSCIWQNLDVFTLKRDYKII